MTFVDTSAWYASVVPSDPMHHPVTAWLQSNTDALITTDYVVDEALTLIRMRGETARAIDFGRRVFDLKLVGVHFLRPDEIRDSWKVFRDNPGRRWSFTDCTSKVIIEKFHIHRVLTFDHHFGEFGSISILP